MQSFEKNQKNQQNPQIGQLYRPVPEPTQHHTVHHQLVRNGRTEIRSWK